MLFPLVLAVAVSASWWPPILVLLLFFLLESTVANLVEPWLFSSRTGISSLALLASAIFWAMLWGWPGLVLSTPLTVCLVVMGRYVPQLSFLNSLLGTNVQLSPAAHFYERLLAADQTEAYAIAERYLEGRSLVDLYDDILIPALALAEEDRHKGSLDPGRSRFIFLVAAELIARLSGFESPQEASDALQGNGYTATRTKQFAVICISGGDEADQLTTLMLTQILERAHYQTLSLRPEALSEEILRGLACERNTVIVISALPPFAFAAVRELCQKTRKELVENRIAVGLWNTFEESGDVLPRFGSQQPDCVLGTLAQALGQVKTWKDATRWERG